MVSAFAMYLAGLNPPTIDLAKVKALIDPDPSSAARLIRQTIKDDELAKGATPVDEGTSVLFALNLPGGDHQVTVAAGEKVLSKLKKLDGTLYASVEEFADGDAYPVEYRVDGKGIRSGLQLEVYRPNPLTQAPPEGMKGELRSMGELKSTIYPGTIRQWYVYLPPHLDSSKEYPLLVGQDAQWDRQWQAYALENCAREGKIPPTVGVFIEPGQDKAGNYSNRSREYDTLSPTYFQFLQTEVLPEVEKLVKLSHDPAKRALVGMSSGGICSFTACWEHPEVFGVALSFIGSFTNIASGESNREGGHNYPFLIRKVEKKPIRVFLQDGANDLNNIHGNWWLANQQMQSALSFKGYDFVWVPGNGFHSSKHARRVFHDALTWWLR